MILESFEILEDDNVCLCVWTGLSLEVLAITVLTRLSVQFLWSGQRLEEFENRLACCMCVV